MGRRYHTFETIFSSLKRALTSYLRTMKIYFETSKDGKYWHFEILCNENEAQMINEWITQHSICEA